MRPSKQLKQLIQINITEYKNPNGPEANQLVVYKRDRVFELGAQVSAGCEVKVQPSNHATTLPSLSVNYHHRDYLEPIDHYVLLELRTISYLFLSKVGIIPSKVSKHFNSFLSLHPFVVKACINNQPHRPPDLRTERSQLIKI